jgi:fibronectin type 3 domain-containing protein
MLRKRSFTSIIFTIVSLVVLLCLCVQPLDPNDPSNTSIKSLLKSSNGQETTQPLIEDSTGNIIRIGAAIHLPKNIDSIGLTISAEDVTVFDTIIRNFKIASNDTIWKAIAFKTAGKKTVTIKPYSQIELLPINLDIIIIAKPGFVEIHQNKPPAWNSDTVKVSITDTATYRLSLSDACTDPDGEPLTFGLLSGNPTGDSILNGVYLFKASPQEIGISHVRIIAADSSNAQDTLFIKLTVTLLPSTSVTLSLLQLSAGTLMQKVAPIPDTIRDTVSFFDSTVTVTPTTWDSLVLISVKGQNIRSSKTSAPIPLVEGRNEIPVIITAGIVNKSYMLIVVRKPNSSIPLTVPPSGLSIDSVTTSIIYLSWDDLFGANLYTVERNKQADENFTIADTVGSNSFCDTGLVAGTAYFYRVKASNSQSSSSFCTAISCTTLAKPAIITQPHDTSVVAGTSLEMSITTTGSSLKYQWRKNGANLPQEISAVLLLSSITVADTGSYSVIASIGNDSVVSTPARVRVLPKSPAEVSAVGRSAFSIGISWMQADGALWYRVLRSYNSGAFSSVCSTSQISTIDTPLVEGGSYTYRVIAGNNDGFSDTSTAFIASTWKGPVITTNLSQTPVTIVDGQPLDLSVIATGTPECTYQWKKNGTDITGATLASYKITPASLADSGSYLVVVTNGVRSVNSYQVKVIVLPTYTLGTTVSPSQGGTVTKVKDTLVYVPGTSVKLIAYKAAGYRFTGWTSGVDTLSKDTILTVVMSKNQIIQANFIRQYTLTLEITGSGTITPAAGTVTVDSGAVTNITASAGAGYKFKQWSTANSGVVFGSSISAATTVKMTQGNATVQAVFKGVTFEKVINQNTTHYSVVQANDGSYYFTGDYYDASFNSYVSVLNLSVNGDSVWAKTYEGKSAKTIRKTTDGFIIACSNSDFSYCRIIKIAPNGVEFFSRNIGFEYGSGSFAEQTTDGGYIVGGTGGTPLQHLIKTNSSGVVSESTTWEKPYDYGERLADGQQTSDGGYVFVGGGVNGNISVVKTGSDGEQKWAKYFGELIGNSIRQTKDGGYIIGATGGSYGQTPYTCCLIKINASGTQEWKKINSIGESTNAARQTSDGGYVYVGYSKFTGAGGTDVYLVKTNATGDTTWTRTFGSSESDETGYSLEITSDGGYIIIGTKDSQGYIIKTDENGNVE